MSWLNLSDIAEMTNGRLIDSEHASINVDAISIDTRQLQASDLFIAIKGERFDAHSFVQGLEGKVSAALVSKVIDCNVPQILVEDTKLALAQLAMAWRSRYSEAVIGLTGSNGKTTLKEMLSAILCEEVGNEDNVLATLGNFNNDIGMPLTLLRIREHHDYAVIEMGANHFDEIDFLSSIAKPNIAVINNAGPAHLEGFGDVEGVSRAKGEIFNGLAEDGIAVINADDKYADYWKGLNQNRKVITFGLQDADVNGEYTGNGSLLIKTEHGKQQVLLQLQGKHNAMNALAATAVALGLGIELPVVKKGLESLVAVSGRLSMVDGVRGIKILDDSYNANPASASAAISVLAEASGTKMMVLGDMGELGGDEDLIHAEVGKQASEAGIDNMFCYGKYSTKACEEFGHPENSFSEMDQLISRLESEIDKKMKNITLLVKGSRSAHMERVVDALKQTGNT